MILKWLPVIHFLCIPMIYEESQFTNNCPCQMLKSVTGFVIYTPAAWLSWWCLQSSSGKQGDKSITSTKTLLLVNSLRIPWLELLRVCVRVCVGVGGWVDVCGCVHARARVCVFPSTVKASPDWNKTNVMPEIRPVMLCWRNYSVPSTFVATS